MQRSHLDLGGGRVRGREAARDPLAQLLGRVAVEGDDADPARWDPARKEHAEASDQGRGLAAARRRDHLRGAIGEQGRRPLLGIERREQRVGKGLSHGHRNEDGSGRLPGGLDPRTGPRAGAARRLVCGYPVAAPPAAIGGASRHMPVTHDDAARPFAPAGDALGAHQAHPEAAAGRRRSRQRRRPGCDGAHPLGRGDRSRVSRAGCRFDASSCWPCCSRRWSRSSAAFSSGSASRSSTTRSRPRRPPASTCSARSGGEQRVNIAIFGYGGAEHKGGNYLADSIQILSIDPRPTPPPSSRSRATSGSRACPRSRTTARSTRRSRSGSCVADRRGRELHRQRAVAGRSASRSSTGWRSISAASRE